jgi:glycosyltransferase involved in cell wall biosynthesis
MPTTILVEPNPRGHRPQAIATVAAVAGRTSDVVVLTSHGASEHPGFRENVERLNLRVVERFDAIVPPTKQIVGEVAAVCRAEDVDRIVVLDADQALKRWWMYAPRALGIRKRPRVMFFLTRYPAKLRLTDWTGWKLRVPKAVLAAATMASGSLDHVAGYAGTDDLTKGWIVKRTRDPAPCSAHSRDRAKHRAELGLPQDRRLVGVFGAINERKNSDLIWTAMQSCSIDADLLLAGTLSPEVATWADTVEPTQHGQVLVRDGFHTNEVLDKYVASVDVAPLAMTLNGPSGIMGKALIADVPVVTAGSVVRAREVQAYDGGEVAELDADSIGAAIERALARDPEAPRRSTVQPPTEEEFASIILGERSRR